MKLLSASAVVAGANSVALADCGLCGDHEHEVGACPHFDYRGYGLSKGYKPETLPSNDFLGGLAVADRQNANAFLNMGQAKTPTSSTISFATPSGETAGSTDTGVATSYDNTWNNTEAASQSSNEKPSASDKLNALKFERTQDLEDAATMVSESDTNETEAAVEEMRRDNAATKLQSARRAQLARRARQEREEIERGQALQNLFNEENARKEEVRLARERDTRELKNMMKESIRKDGGNDPVYDVQTAGGLEILENSLPDRAQIRPRQDAEEVANFNREKINISDMEKLRIMEKNLSEADKRQKDRAHKKAFNAEIARLNEKAARQRDKQELQDMMRERVAEDLGKSDAVKSKSEVRDLSLRHRGSEDARDVAYDNRAKINISDMEKLRIIGDTRVSQADKRRKERAARNRDREELNEMMAASLAKNRKNKRKALESRAKDAHLQAQIAGDYELAKKLQAEEVKAQIQSDEELAKRLQAEYDAEDAQIRAERFAEEQRRLEEEEAHQARVREERERAEREAEERLFAENRRKLEELEREHRLASEATDGGVADEEVETDRWSLPSGTSWSFATFSFYNDSARRTTDRWARQLENLSIRKIECIMWLITTSYQQLQNEGKFAPTAQMAEAISDVNSIFPYSGTNSGVMNVYNAWEHTDTAEFVRDLERLGRDKLDGVLYYVAFRYSQLLDDEENQKQAASSKFVELAKAVLDYFDIGWNTEDVKFVPDNKDVREAPRDPVNFKATDKGIVETEAPETATWNPPYRVYYAYCGELKRGLRPSSKSRELFRDKENRAQLYQDELSKLTIRHLETIIYLAASAYECQDIEGNVDVNKAIKDVRNVFPGSEKPQSNARLVNVWNALGNMVDKPNDNPISMQPFQKGFTALMRDEQENAFIDMAIAYRKKLREGKRPASMAFVRLADAICKVSDKDGFVDGEDKVHPELKFEEFENEAKTAQISDVANANNNPAVTTDDEKEAPDNSRWEAPKKFQAIFNGFNIRGNGLDQFQRHVSRLTVRQQEALIYETVSVYVGHLGSNRVCELSPDLDRTIRAVYNRFNEHKGDRLMNVVRASACAVGFKNEVEEMFESSPQQAFRWVEKLLGAIVQVYKEKLDGGAKPADWVFTDLVSKVFKVFGLDGGNYSEEDNPNPAALEDNSYAKEVRTTSWQLPIYKANRMFDRIHREYYDWYDIDEWKEKMFYLNVRQLEVMLVEFAKVYLKNRSETYDRMEEKMEAVLKAYENLGASDNNATVAEFRSAMDKARGKVAFESDDDDGQASVGRSNMSEALEGVIEEYIRKLETANPVTEEFRRAVK